MKNPTLYYASCVSDENIFNEAVFKLTDSAIENVWNVDGMTEFRPLLQQGGNGDLFEQLAKATLDLTNIVATFLGISLKEAFHLWLEKLDSLIENPSV